MFGVWFGPQVAGVSQRAQRRRHQQRVPLAQRLRVRRAPQRAPRTRVQRALHHQRDLAPPAATATTVRRCHTGKVAAFNRFAVLTASKEVVTLINASQIVKVLYLYLGIKFCFLRFIHNVATALHGLQMLKIDYYHSQFYNFSFNNKKSMIIFYEKLQIVEKEDIFEMARWANYTTYRLHFCKVLGFRKLNNQVLNFDLRFLK